jgi:anion-transporting  ArsA/GET3 family ATPase
MLDPKATFDRIVGEEAADEVQRNRVLSNEFYRHMSGGLSGTQEYMAVELLHQLVHDDRFDLVVVDTPPSRQALDVVDAPARLVALLDSRLYRLLTSSGRGPLRAFTAAARSFVKLLSGAVGAQVVQDAIDFFATFEGMEGGFVDRANSVAAILASGSTHVTVVTTPRPDAVTEAALLAAGLSDRGIGVGSVVVNMAHDDPLERIPAIDVATLDGLDPDSPHRESPRHRRAGDARPPRRRGLRHRAGDGAPPRRGHPRHRRAGPLRLPPHRRLTCPSGPLSRSWR